MLYDNAQPTYDRADAVEFVRTVNEDARRHRALHHPLLRALVAGDFPNPQVALKDFTFQYLAYSNDFLRYLTATIAQLEERPHREMLVQNLMEEAGKVDPDDARVLAEAGIDIAWVQGVPHPVLYTRFLTAIGIGADFRGRTPFCDEALTWRRMFLATCASGGAAQALGAMGLGTENIVKYVYREILDAIARWAPVTGEDRVFFDLHALVDDEHGQVIEDISVDYAQYRRNREALRNGMLMALDARAAFFDGMLLRCRRVRAVGEGPTASAVQEA